MDPAKQETTGAAEETGHALQPAPPPALEMIDVSVAAQKSPGQSVLEGVNWSVAVGDFWAIGGLHASGKSDFMMMAAGIMRPVAGVYRVFGQELSASFGDACLQTRLRLGLVFDGGQLLNNLTVAENVALPIRYHQESVMVDADARVEALLQVTGLATWAESYPNNVPRNLQQRAGLARALALQPEVLFLDSPLTGLDPPDARWWLNLLGRLAGGHPIMGGRLMTLVVSGDDLRPWQGRARQFAALRDRQFVPLQTDPLASDELLQSLLGQRNADT